jgi:hypothetical protein
MFFLTKEMFLLFFTVFYFYQNRRFVNYFNNLITILNSMNCFSSLISNIYYEDEFEEENKENNIEDKNQHVLKEIKYEDKYLLEIRNMNKDFKLNEEEIELTNKKLLEILDLKKKEYLDTYYDLNNKLSKIEKRLTIYEDKDYDDSIEDDFSDEYYIVGTREEKINLLLSQQKKYWEEKEIL